MSLGVLDSFEAAALALVGAVVLGHVALAVCRRPQLGLLILALLLPFDGLLQIVSFGETVGPWKEALTCATLAATFVAPASARRRPPDGGETLLSRLPGWVPALVVFVALGLVSAVVVGGTVGTWGFKIGYFYLLVPIILWRCPFDARDRDRLVTILMGTAVAVGAFGLVQQVLGPERLNALGWEYNTAIRFSGDLMRSFSTFTQPFSFGLYLGFVLLVALPVAMADWQRTRNLLFLVASPFLVVAMASSVVRGAMLALVVGGLVLAAWRFRGLLHAGVPALVALAFVPASALTAYFSSSSLGERTSGWSDIISLVAAAPLGNGVGTTGAAAEKSLELGVDPDLLVTVPSTTGVDLYLPDNQYVKTAIELGPIGLWLFLLLGAGIIASAFAAARRTEGDDRALAQGIAAATIGAAAASLVSTYLEIFPLDFYFWLTVGILLCLDTASASTPSPSAPAAAGSRPTSASSSAR
ncbi:O-antigen ligase family protein [Nocardioides sp. C4-1]|uniref:O-antigen ligase family protein n=1 Tax=Nocardioides sp. C4-1 TaxID=3151851 RepID=UPI003267AB5E